MFCRKPSANDDVHAVKRPISDITNLFSAILGNELDLMSANKIDGVLVALRCRVYNRYLNKFVNINLLEINVETVYLENAT